MKKNDEKMKRAAVWRSRRSVRLLALLLSAVMICSGVLFPVVSGMESETSAEVTEETSSAAPETEEPDKTSGQKGTASVKSSEAEKETEPEQNTEVSEETPDETETGAPEETAPESPESETPSEGAEPPAETADDTESEATVSSEESSETEEPAQTEEQPAEPGYLTGKQTVKGKDYVVTVEVPKSAKIPENAALKVKEITKSRDEYEDYLKKTTDALEQPDLSLARFFDISFQIQKDGTDVEIEPEDKLQVTIRLDRDEKTNETADELGETKEEVKVVHFEETKGKKTDEEDLPKVLKTKTSGEKVSFYADSFSVFGVIYTVDFHWNANGETYDFSLPGGGCVSFSELLKALGIVREDAKSFVDEVEKVEFSDPELVWVGKIDSETTVGALKESKDLHCEYSEELTEAQINEINGQTVTAGDWALISLKAFDTEETLTVTMKNGDTFLINVTDDQENPFGLDGKTFAILAQKNNTTYSMRNVVSSTNANCLSGYTVSGNQIGIGWTFEWTGEGKKYLIHDNNNRYLLIEDDKVSLTDRETALANPITVVSRNGKYSFVNEKNNQALNIYGTSGFGRWPFDEANDDFLMSLQLPSNVSKPGTIATADTSDVLQINLFNYGPEDQLDTVNNHNGNPANAGVNIDHTLKFFSYGNVVGTGVNDFTGQGNGPQTGIVADQLSGNYPVLASNPSESLNYLFGGEANSYVTAYNGLNHLFTKDEDGYYHYDSNQNYAYYNSSGGNKDFTVYSKTFPEEGADEQYFGVGFFPFNDYDENYNCIHGRDFNWDGSRPYGNSRQGHYDHHFGMELSAQFIYPPGGQYNGKDVMFHFSGDDDMWVFVDGVLIMDIGGIHNPVAGDINFKTGEVTVHGEAQENFKDKYKRITGNDWDDSDFSSHDFRVFYMERGGMYSNLELTFNLPLTGRVEAGDFDFEKVSAKNESVKLQGAEFSLYTSPACDEPFTLADVPVKATSGKDGVVSFQNIPYGTYYMKETAYPDGYQAKTPEEVYTVIVGESGTTIKTSFGNTVTKITNEPETIDVSVKKNWENGSAPDGASIEIVLGRYKLVEDPNAPGKGTLVIRDSYTGLPSGSNYQVTYTITGPNNYSQTISKTYSAASENIEISVPDVPAGVQYTVTKQVTAIPHYNITNSTGTQTVTVPKNDTAAVQFNQSAFSRNSYRVRVYAVNNQNTSNLELYSENYYPAGSSLSVNISNKNANTWIWGNKFTVSSSAGGSRQFSSNGSWQFTNNLNQDIDLYVKCDTSSGWQRGWDQINTPTITGATPVNAAAAPAKAPAQRAALTQTATPPAPPEAPTDTVYVIDDEYAQDPDKITLSDGTWTGKASGLDAFNEYGPYVYYIAEVNETGMPGGVTIDIADDVTFKGETKVLHVTNTMPSTGSLKLKKTFSGLNVSELSAAQKDAITFTITGPDNYSETIKLSELDENLETIISGLTPGEYTVTETRPDSTTPGGYKWISTTYSVENGKTTVSRGETAEVTVTNTYQKLIDVTLKKVDKSQMNDDDPPLLDGAAFTLTKYTGKGGEKDESWGDHGSKTLRDEKDGESYTLGGTFTFKGLEEGYYVIDEIVLPTGYKEPAVDPAFYVEADPSGNLSIRIDEAVGGNIALVDGELTLLIGNESGATLPLTGGPGTWIFTISGAILTIGAAILIIRKIRR